MSPHGDGVANVEEREDAPEMGPRDEQLPACIVMEKGECLVDYLARNKGSMMLEDQQFGLRVRCFLLMQRLMRPGPEHKAHPVVHKQSYHHDIPYQHSCLVHPRSGDRGTFADWLRSSLGCNGHLPWSVLTPES